DKEPKLGVEQIITLIKIRNGISQNLKMPIVAQLEKIGLVEKLPGHTLRYTLSEDYEQLVSDGLKIGKRYIVQELERILLELQGNALKVGALEASMEDFMKRSQIRYLLLKLVDDEVVIVDGVLRGTRYSLSDRFKDLRGDKLIAEVLAFLRSKYDSLYP
ncbi:MAG TPA: hypothetical protein DCS64_03600, partial [Algoriphagus sp.]